MYNLGDDKELDRLSREAAGNYTPPSEANWQALSDELDIVMPVEKKKRRILFFWWLLPLLLIGGALTWWLLPENSSSAQPTMASLKELSTATAKNNTVLSGGDSSSQLSSPNNQSAVTVIKQPAKQEELPTTSTKNSTITSDVMNSMSQTKKTVTSSTNTSLNRKATRKSGDTKIIVTPNTQMDIGLSKQQNLTNNNNTTKLATPITNTTSTDPVLVKEHITSEKTTVVLESAKENNKTSLAKEEIKTESTSNTLTPVADEQPIVTVKKIPKSGFSFGILVGVDKSTVKFKYSNDAGFNAGVLGGYHINDTWSFHTGISYTRKNYKVAGEDFTAPKGTPISYYTLEDVTGYCSMWEIPLLVRYTVSRSAKKSVFLSTGLSSYFMNREDYDYFYYFNGQPVIRHGSPSTTNNPILSILHVSAGFEKKLSSNWTLQIEPYAKLPLGGVGFGDIRLSSFGLNFSAQFRQLSKK